MLMWCVHRVPVSDGSAAPKGLSVVLAGCVCVCVCVIVCACVCLCLCVCECACVCDAAVLVSGGRSAGVRQEGEGEWRLYHRQLWLCIHPRRPGDLLTCPT